MKETKKIVLIIFLWIIMLFIMMSILFKGVEATWYSEIKETARNITAENQSIYNKTLIVDKYLWKTNNYTFLYYKKDLKKYWEDKLGDCTEIARIKRIMYSELKIRSRIVHGCVMINNSCNKHDYLEYYSNNEWITNEQEFYNDKIIKKGRGIW